MKSFQELYCEQHQCEPEKFLQKVFLSCLHRRALCFVSLLGGINSEYFAADRELVAGAGRATHMRQVREEIRDYMMSSDNRGSLRQTWKVRISARRLMALASRFLPGADSLPPAEERRPVVTPGPLPMKYEYTPR